VLAAVQRPIAAACLGVAVERPLWKDAPTGTSQKNESAWYGKTVVAPLLPLRWSGARPSYKRRQCFADRCPRQRKGSSPWHMIDPMRSDPTFIRFPHEGRFSLGNHAILLGERYQVGGPSRVRSFRRGKRRDNAAADRPAERRQTRLVRLHLHLGRRRRAKAESEIDQSVIVRF